jgi:hypothetical protein
MTEFGAVAAARVRYRWLRWTIALGLLITFIAVMGWIVAR